MRNQDQEALEKRIKILAYYQMGGGVLGMGFNIAHILTVEYIKGPDVIIFLLALGLFFFSIICGVKLLNEPEQGLTYSLINQFLQLPMFSLAGYVYKFTSGILILIGFDLTSDFIIKFEFAITSYDFRINTYSEEIKAGINIVALILVLLINRIQQRFDFSKDDISEEEPLEISIK